MPQTLLAHASTLAWAAGARRARRRSYVPADTLMVVSDVTPIPGSEGDGQTPSLEPRSGSMPDLPFRDLEAPSPVEPAPTTPARWLAFAGIIVGGLLGALVGYGIGDVLYPDSIGSAVGAFLGGVTGAVGVGVLANLTLRAMNEWHTANHPEATGTETADQRRAGARRKRRE
jgi:hypothetical protein